MKSCWTRYIVIVLALGVLLHWFRHHSGFFLWTQQPLQYMPNMHRTPSLKPQRGYAFFEDFSSSRTAPEGSLAREQTPYKFKGSQFLAQDVDKFSNPVPATREVLARGKYIFENNCIVCHGRDGNGNGPIVPKFPNPPSLLSDKIRGFADSQIYHVFVNGQNTMGSYAAQIRDQDRWPLIHYVRVLQLADRPSAEDLQAFDQLVKKGAQ